MGESIEQLHERVACTLDRIVAQSDADPARPRGLLICTHAATLIAIGRVLTGSMPSNVVEPDFRPFTASLSVFVRRRREQDLGGEAGDADEVDNQDDIAGGGGEDEDGDVNEVDIQDVTTDGRGVVEWRNGKGIGGGWDCVRNGDCSFLKGGEESGW